MEQKFKFVKDSEKRETMVSVLKNVRKAMRGVKEQCEEDYEIFLLEEDFNTIFFYEFEYKLEEYANNRDGYMYHFIESYGIHELIKIYKKYGGTKKKPTCYDLFIALSKYTWESRDKTSLKSIKNPIQPMRPDLHLRIADLRRAHMDKIELKIQSL